MYDDTPRPVHVQRCTYQEVRGGIAWQCLGGDPHPSGQGHTWSIDARFGRRLDEQKPEWLAAHLRDQVALNDNLQRQVDQLTAIAVDLATGWAGGVGVRPGTATWVAKNAPTAARLHGWAGE